MLSLALSRYEVGLAAEVMTHCFALIFGVIL